MTAGHCETEFARQADGALRLEVVPAGAAHLIRIEGDLRGCTKRDALWQHLLNESVALLPYDQALVLQTRDTTPNRSPQATRWIVAAVAGLVEVDRDALMLLRYENLARCLWLESKGDLRPMQFELPSHADLDDARTCDATARHVLWLPLADDGQFTGAGWLLAKNTAWDPGQVKLAQRLAAAYAHGASAIAGRARPRTAWTRRWPRLALPAVVGAVFLSLVPVPLTILAPAEVTAQDPFVVAAPVFGVVERILVQPGAQVRAGDRLVQLVDTTLRSDYEVAQQKLKVARARTRSFQQASVDDADASRELAVARTEEAAAAAERDFARAMLDKAVIKAERSGVALYADPREWVGRPVAVGEAIVRVADPRKVEFVLKVPVAEAATLRQGAHVKVFLDSAPLDPLDATVVRAGYKAETDAAGVLSFTVVARATDLPSPPPRLGLRGTARVRGDKVALIYYLLRKPIIAARQWTGF